MAEIKTPKNNNPIIQDIKKFNVLQRNSVRILRKSLILQVHSILEIIFFLIY